MRISERKLNPSLKKQILTEFVQTILDFKKFKDLETFVKDFFNDSELETFTKRLAVVYWLKKKRSYNNIKDNLKVSSATIATVQNLLDTSGIKLAIKKMEAEEWANKWSEKIKEITKK